MKKDFRNRLAEMIHDANAETLLSLSCPVCGGSLSIQYTTVGKAAGSLAVMCPQCIWRVICDGLPAEPPWVRELGPKVQTTKRSKSAAG